MQIELTQSEIKIIEQALDTWEKDANTGALFGTMIGAMLTPRAERDQDKFKMDRELEMAKATEEGQRRKRVSTLLRAKLYQADARQSEHSLETT